MSGRGPKIGFAVIVALGFLFTLVAFFTPGWRHYKNGGGEPNFGLVTYNCGSNQNQVNPSDCKEWWTVSEYYFQYLQYYFIKNYCKFLEIFNYVEKKNIFFELEYGKFGSANDLKIKPFPSGTVQNKVPKVSVIILSIKYF